jgi:uncharacterized protein YjbI with pentapeptide repeats
MQFFHLGAVYSMCRYFEKLSVVTAIVCLSTGQIAMTRVAEADIYQWQYVDPLDLSKGKTASTVLTTDGAEANAVPGADLQKRRLNKAYLANKDLTSTIFFQADLTQADLSGANLTDADLGYAALQLADFTNATVVGANFATQTGGLTAAQFYSTASYKNKNITGINLYGNNLTGWDLNDQMIQNVEFRETNGLTSGHIYSTASYKTGDLRGVKFESLDVSNWDYANQNLEGASFNFSDITNTNFSGANVRDASFHAHNFDSLTQSQLYSTASYQEKDLAGIGFMVANLSGWDLSGQNLTFAFMDSCDVSNVDFENANLTYAVFDFSSVHGTSFKNANIHGASFWFAMGLTAEQLYESNSYQMRDLGSLGLYGINIQGWDFMGQEMALSIFEEADLSNANFKGANLVNSSFRVATLVQTNLVAADLRGSSGVNLTQALASNLIRPDGTIEGLILAAGEDLVIRDHDGTIYSQAPSGPIAVHVQEQFKIDDQASLRLLFDEDHWDSVISFAHGIPVQFDGILKLDFATGTNVRNQVGRTFRAFDWSGVDLLGAPTVASPYHWDLSNLYTTGEFTLLAIPEPSGVCLILASALILSGHWRRTS